MLYKEAGHMFTAAASLSGRQMQKKRRTDEEYTTKRNSCNCPAIPTGDWSSCSVARAKARWVCLSLVRFSKTGNCWPSSGVPPPPRGRRTDHRGGHNTWAHHILRLLWPAPAARSGRLAVGRQTELFQEKKVMSAKPQMLKRVDAAFVHSLCWVLLKWFHTSSPFPAHPGPRVFFLSSDWSC